MKFNEKLILLRKQNGYSQEQLAEKIGVSRQAVSRWEAGETTPEMALLVKICNIFDVTADYLIHDEIENEKDIPIIKKKEEEVKTISLQKNRLYLFSAICFVIAAFSALMATVTSTNDIQLVISCFNLAVLSALSVFQFTRYFKNK